MHTWMKSTRNISRSISYPLTDKANQTEERIAGFLCGGGIIDTGNKEGIVKQFTHILNLGGRKFRRGLNGEYPIQGIIRTLSFSENEIPPDDPEWVEKALNVTQAVMDNIAPDCQYIAVAQKDGKAGLVHVHIVQNVLHTSTLKAVSGRETNYDIFRKKTEEIMERQGIELDAGKNHSKRNNSMSKKRQKHAKESEGYSWMEDLENRISAAVSETTATGDFEARLHLYGVSVSRKTKRGWTFVLQESTDDKYIGKKAAYDRFSTDFSMQALNMCFKENYMAAQPKKQERRLPDISNIIAYTQNENQYGR